jgi:hypothetical protein
MLISLFFSYGNEKKKKRGTHFRVSFDSMAYMVAIKSFPPLLCSQNAIPSFFAQLWNTYNDRERNSLSSYWPNI